MTATSKAIGAQLPYLRRFARALCGSQESGDVIVAATLKALIADPSLISGEQDTKLGLYRLLLHVAQLGDREQVRASLAVDRRIQAMSPRPRVAFLLTALEGFSVEEAAHAMVVGREQCSRLLDAAGQEIAAQLASDVLVIEDELLIALDVTELVTSMGHTVRHVARTRRQAIEAVGQHRPTLVLADIQLADGSSGISAVQDILRSIDVPVIFITAYPERLLTGEVPEPTYVVAKPFLSETVKALISQAQFFHAAR